MAREFQFYIVPTPIGNIQDITFRAIEILKTVDLIACEDTRVTQKLLNNYDIKTKCISYHKYNEKERIEYFLDVLRDGKKIALVSDAGTPMICDPGAIIVSEVINSGFSVSSLPGACAITTFLSEIPRDNENFTFIGFMPRSEKQIEDVSKKLTDHNFVFYESPERILKTLKIIQSVRGDIKVALGRELSKLFEEVLVDNISSILCHFKDGIKGEIVCMVYAIKDFDTTKMEYRIKKLKDKGFRDKDIAIILATLFEYNKNEVYKKCLEV